MRLWESEDLLEVLPVVIENIQLLGLDATNDVIRAFLTALVEVHVKDCAMTLMPIEDISERKNSLCDFIQKTDFLQSTDPNLTFH